MPRNLDRRRVQVDAVCNDTKVRPLLMPLIQVIVVMLRTEHAENTRIAVMQRAHRVEQMRDHGCASRYGGGCFFVGGLRVADGDQDAAGGQVRDEGGHGAELGGDGYHFDGDV